MDWIEVTAKTVEVAKELALDRLGVVESELEFEVVDEPRSGLFRRQDARIRARVKPISREKPQDRRRRSKQERGRREGQGSRRGNDRTEGKPKGEATPAGSAKPQAAESRSGEAGAAGAGTAGSSNRRRRRSGGGGGNRPQNGEQQTKGTQSAPRSEPLEAEMDSEQMPIGEQADFAADFVGDLVTAMGLTATIRTELDDNDMEVMVDGDDLGVLLGPRGVTMQALEEVTRAALSRHAGGKSARVHLDVAGYRQRRRAALADFARKVAEEVVTTGESRSLEPMNAADRKVVHDTVAEIDGVVT
ncbi:MAG: protein jag, partial [Actinomycetota bacterium]